MTTKVDVNGFIRFVLFLEEFIFWNPRYFNTIVEKVFLALPIDFITQSEVRVIGSYINPALFILLFLSSYSSIIKFVTSYLGEHAKADILIWLERNKFIKAILAVGLAVFMLFFVVKPVVDSSNFSLMNVYQDKSLWSILFSYMIVKRLISEDLY